MQLAGVPRCSRSPRAAMIRCAISLRVSQRAASSSVFRSIHLPQLYFEAGRAIIVCSFESTRRALCTAVALITVLCSPRIKPSGAIRDFLPHVSRFLWSGPVRENFAIRYPKLSLENEAYGRTPVRYDRTIIRRQYPVEEVFCVLAYTRRVYSVKTVQNLTIWA